MGAYGKPGNLRGLKANLREMLMAGAVSSRHLIEWVSVTSGVGREQRVSEEVDLT